MEVDTESSNTSLEDKTEDFCDNPTRDALTEGLMRLLKPTVDQLDDRVRAVRISHLELKQQIDSLSEEVRKIKENSCNKDKDIDLEVYIRKLINVKQKITVVSSILQSTEERLHKIQANIVKDSAKHKSLLDSSSYPSTTAVDQNSPSIQ